MATRSTLTKIFHRVMRGAVFMTDINQYDKREHWVLPPDVDAVTGDCEDIALAIISVLAEHEIQGNLLYCLTERKEGHIVVEYDGWILDNRQKKVVTRTHLDRQGYQWVSMNVNGTWRKIS